MEDKSPRTVEVATVYLRRTRAHELIKIQKAAESEGTRLTDFFKRKVITKLKSPLVMFPCCLV